MRLIDAEALINEWNGLIKLMATNSDGVVPVDFGAVIEAISKAPTIDAVEVVRCKDCRSHNMCNFEQYQGLDGFCSYGERRPTP